MTVLFYGGAYPIVSYRIVRKYDRGRGRGRGRSSIDYRLPQNKEEEEVYMI